MFVCMQLSIYQSVDLFNTSLNKSRAWYIDTTTNKKNPYDFYKVLIYLSIYLSIYFRLSLFFSF